MNDIILKETKVYDKRVEYYFEARGSLSSYFSTDKMFVEYNISIEGVPVSILNTAFVASVLPIVWLTNTTMWIDKLDRTFYDCLYRLRIAYQDLYPHYHLGGKLVAARLEENNYVIKRESLLLFSGGLDATVSYTRIKDTNPIICNIQGWYEAEEEKHIQAAKSEHDSILNFTKENNLDFSFVKSNFATIVNISTFNKNILKKLGDSWWHGFQHSMSFISIAMPIAYKMGVKNIYIASSFALGREGQCASYATTDIEFKFAGEGGCVHDAFELSRQDKVHVMVQYQKESKKTFPIKVCSFNNKNCCECEKCFRTILEIVAENGNPRSFGFEIEEDLKKHWVNVFDRRMHLFGVKGEKRKHWPDIIRRMKENYNNIEDKEFVDWFLNTDFTVLKKNSVKKYYCKDFFKILKRKITG